MGGIACRGVDYPWFMVAFPHKMYVQSTRSSFVFLSGPGSDFCRSKVGSLREARGRGVPFPPSSSPGALSRVGGQGLVAEACACVAAHRGRIVRKKITRMSTSRFIEHTRIEVKDKHCNPY